MTITEMTTIEKLKARLDHVTQCKDHAHEDTMQLLRECKAALEEQEAELAFVDSILARRPALESFATRSAKIEHAINTAKQVDQLQSTLAQRDKQCAEMREALEWANVFIPVDYDPSEELTELNDRNRARRTKRRIKDALSSTAGQNHVNREEFTEAVNELVDSTKEDMARWKTYHGLTEQEQRIFKAITRLESLLK